MPDRLPRRRIRTGRQAAAIATVVTVLLAFAPLSFAASGARPPEILSWRHQSLDQAEYPKLAEQWEAFVKANPKDARALVEWGNALRYSGKGEEANLKYQQAFETDSLDAAAVEAYASSLIIRHGEEPIWKTAYQMLVRSLARDPSYAKTLYTLWYSALHAGDEALAERCLRGMVETGDMPRPLLEYGGNMVEGAPPNAIILTNGDNDTYPPLAYQLLTGRRHDVTIANLSLLNTSWYIRYLKGAGLPITLTDTEIDALKPKSKEILPAVQVVEHLAGNLGKAPTRPLLYAVTVPSWNRHLATGEAQGLQVPVIIPPKPAEQNSDAAASTPCNWVRTRELLDTVYRTDGPLDPLVDWKRESAVAKLARNYGALYCGVADWLVSAGQKAEAGGYYLRAIRLFAFQQDREEAQRVLDDWTKADPQSKLLVEARRLLEK
jgi:tetratricopeptide (TPR) repeat protein